jgi:serine/threonine protein kinase
MPFIRGGELYKVF